MYAYDSRQHVVLRTLNPYCGFYNTSHFAANPLVDVIGTDDGSFLNGFFIEPTQGALLTSIDSQWETYSNIPPEVWLQAKVQLHQIGEGTYVQTPWRFPFLPNAAKASSKKLTTKSIGLPQFAIDTTVTPNRGPPGRAPCNIMFTAA